MLLLFFTHSTTEKPSLFRTHPTTPTPESHPTAAPSHLVRGSVLLAAASGRLLVVLAHVHHLTLGALSDQVPAHAGNILEAVAWQGEGRGGRGVGVTHKFI